MLLVCLKMRCCVCPARNTFGKINLNRFLEISEGKKNFGLFFMDYERPISVSDFAKILRFMMPESTWDSCFAA